MEICAIESVLMAYSAEVFWWYSRENCHFTCILQVGQ